MATTTTPVAYSESCRPTIVVRDSEEYSAITFALLERIRVAEAFAQNRRFSEHVRAGYAREAEILKRWYDSL